MHIGGLGASDVQTPNNASTELEAFIRQCEKHVIGNTWGPTGVCIVLTASPTGLRASFAKWVIREHQLTRVSVAVRTM